MTAIVCGGTAHDAPHASRLFDKLQLTGADESAKLAAELGFKVCV